MATPRNLRYSPANWLIVNWADTSGTPFDACGLPKPVACLTGGDACGETCAHSIPITEAIDTYGWDRWLPEVIVGIDDPDEEIAANYVRQAAIDFCEGGRVLQREIRIDLQPQVDLYPVFPYDGERIVGIIGLRTEDGPFVCGSGCSGQADGLRWRLDTARNELHLSWDCRPSTCGVLRFLVWSAPTEASCAHDIFLYDNFRRAVAEGARRAYALAVHFRDTALLRVLPPPRAFDEAIVLAKTKAMRLTSGWHGQASSAFGGVNCVTREDFYRTR